MIKFTLGIVEPSEPKRAISVVSHIVTEKFMC